MCGFVFCFTGRSGSNYFNTRRNRYIRVRMLSGSIGPVFDPVVCAVDSTPNLYSLLEGTTVLGHCGSDVHVFVCCEKRKYTELGRTDFRLLVLIMD